MNQPDPAAPGFSEQSLRQAIINTWGPAGAHIDVYDHLLAALATAEEERDLMLETHRHCSSLRDRLAASEAVVEAAANLEAKMTTHLNASHSDGCAACRLVEALAAYADLLSQELPKIENAQPGATGEGS